MAKKKSYKGASNNSGLKGLAVLQFFVSLALAIVIVCAVGSEGFTKKDIRTWFKQAQAQTGGDEDTTGMLLTVSDYNDDSTMLMTLTAVEENGIAVQSETSNIFELQVTPQPFPWGSVTWSVAYENPESSFAKNNQITNVLTLTQQGDLTATVECKQAFSEPIIITATHTDDESITASCKADYLQRLSKVTPILNAEVNGTEYSFTGGSPLFTLDSAPDFNKACYQLRLSGIYTIPYPLNNVTFTYSVKIHEDIAKNLNNYILNLGAPGAVGATSWTVIDTTSVAKVVGVSQSDATSEVYNVTMAGLNYSNSANFCSVFYPIMLETTGKYNNNLSYFLKAFDGVFNNPSMPNVGTYHYWYYGKVVMTVNGESYVFEDTSMLSYDSIRTVSSISFNQSNIVF